MQKTIMISRPNMGASDATRYTYKWADQVIKRARYLGYGVYDYKKSSVNYENITNGLIKHNPDVYMHFGHGCPDSLIGQESCIVMNDMEDISNDKAYGEDINCMPFCGMPPNVNLLKDKVVISVACHSAKNLGDFAMLALDWLSSGPGLGGDTNRDEEVDSWHNTLKICHSDKFNDTNFYTSQMHQLSY